VDVGDEPVQAIWVVIGREADPRSTSTSLALRDTED
jgi:hypothetical protein